MRIFAADLSMNRPGIAVVDYDEATGVPTVLTTEALRLDKPLGKRHGQKLAELYVWLMDRMMKWKPNVFVREKAFSRYNKETQTLNKVVGISDTVLWNLRDNVAPVALPEWDFRDDNREFIEIPPVSIKKIVTGNAWAKKQEVADSLAQYVGTREYKYDDESDAVAVAIAYLIRSGHSIQMRMVNPNPPAA